MLDSTVELCYGCGAEITGSTCQYYGRQVNDLIEPIDLSFENTVTSSGELYNMSSYGKLELFDYFS